jgi:hypothetical protein
MEKVPCHSIIGWNLITSIHILTIILTKKTSIYNLNYVFLIHSFIEGNAHKRLIKKHFSYYI